MKLKMRVPSDSGLAVVRYHVRKNGGVVVPVSAAGSAPEWVTFYDVGAVSGGDSWTVQAENSAGLFGAISTLTYSPSGPFTADFYASLTGSDTTGDGSLGNPWRTIQKLVDNVGPGKVGAIRGGTWTAASAGTPLIDTGSQHGSAGNLRRIVGYPGERPLLRGAVLINSRYTTVEDVDISNTYSTSSNDNPVGIARGGSTVQGSGFIRCEITPNNTAQQGVLIGGGSIPADDCFVLGCIIHDVIGGSSGPGHGIYHQNGTRLRVSGNIFYKIGTGSLSGTRAVQLYPVNTYALVEHNTIDECNGGVVDGNESSSQSNGGHVGRWNIFSNLLGTANSRGAWSSTNPHTVGGETLLEDNNVFNNGAGDFEDAYATVVRTTTVNPNYADRAGRDYHQSALPNHGAYASATPPWR